ncbi:aldehyde dehydrogenase family protein [Mycobacterium heckeshornense]|uniref:aldehyde dehydrogenase family protein n=1 Tax=Mycobacterium heckeshornense TaxID=110505 RepID=UPI00308459BA
MRRGREEADPPVEDACLCPVTQRIRIARGRGKCAGRDPAQPHSPGAKRPARISWRKYTSPYMTYDNSRPVLSVTGFKDDDDAVRIANESIYGLSGVVFASGLNRAKAVACRIRTGTLGINSGPWCGADAPFGGYKQSGIGGQCVLKGWRSSPRPRP